MKTVRYVLKTYKWRLLALALALAAFVITKSIVAPEPPPPPGGVPCPDIDPL